MCTEAEIREKNYPEMVSPFMIFWMLYGDLPSTKIEALKKEFPESKYVIAVLGEHLFFRVRSADTERFVVEAQAIGLEPGEYLWGPGAYLPA